MISEISDFRFPIEDLTPSTTPAVSGGERSAASADTSVSKAARSNIYPARGGASRTALLSQAERGTIIDQARPIIIKEILALHGGDMPDPRAYKNYLGRLPFVALCLRRDQLALERQERVKEKELRRQPELPERPQRQMSFYLGRKS